MAGEWRPSTIGELCDAGVADLQTGPFGTQLHAHDYVDEGVPVVPTEAIRNRQIDHTVLPKISPRKAEELARHRLEPGDILFARRGVQAAGHVGYVRAAEEGFLCGTGAIRLRLSESGRSVRPDFLSHVLANPASVEWFKFHAIGATMPNLNEGIIRSFPLRIPPPSEQRAIAHILGTLDDKIELTTLIESLDMTIVATAIRKDQLVGQYSHPSNPDEIALRFGLERVYYSLQRQKLGNERTPVILECRGAREDAELELEFRRICAGGNQTAGPLPFDPTFVRKAANVPGLQVADLTARPIARHIMDPTQPNRAFAVIEKKMDRSPRGRTDGWGLKILP